MKLKAIWKCVVATNAKKIIKAKNKEFSGYESL